MSQSQSLLPPERRAPNGFESSGDADMTDSGNSTEIASTQQTPGDGVDESSRERRAASLPERFLRGRPRPQWREEFPYHWSADDLVTRRDTLRFLVAGSGALVLASAALAVVGSLRPAAAGPLTPIARVGEVPVNGSRVFTYPDQYSQGILVNLPGKGLVAYSDVCTHLSCAVLYQPENQQFHCPCHEGYFDAYTGDVLAGPPTRPLPIIQLEVRADTVYAVREEER
jgi:Rieske Fe-S protein